MGYVRRIRKGHEALALGDRRRYGVARRLWLTASVVLVDGYRTVFSLLEAPFIWSARQLPPALSAYVVRKFDIHPYGRRLG